MANPAFARTVLPNPMNAVRTVSFGLALGLVTLALSSCANTSSNSNATITNAPVAGANNLQVVMTIPPSWHPMLEDRVDDAFVSHLADIFRQEGFQGNLVDVRLPDQPNPNYPVLNINLLNWRMDHSGSIECNFSASVQSQGSMQSLGVFNGMAIRWMQGPGRFGLADTFGQAADDALRQLYRQIARTGFVPGFVTR